MREVYDLLNKNDRKNWSVEDQQTYLLLEKLVLFQDNQSAEIFDNIKKVTTAMMNLDFSQRVELPEAYNKQRNLYFYFASTLNLMNEQLEGKALFVHFADEMLNQLSASTGIITTNALGEITYANAAAINAIGMEREGLRGRNIDMLIGNFHKLKTELAKGERIKDRPVVLAFLAKHVTYYRGLLSVTLVKDNLGKITGYVFQLQPDESKTPAVENPLDTGNTDEDETSRLIQEYKQLQAFWTEQSQLLSADEVLALDYHINYRSGKSDMQQSAANMLEQQYISYYQSGVDKLKTSLQQFSHWIDEKAKTLKEMNPLQENLTEETLIPLSETGDLPEILRQYHSLWKTWINKGALLSVKEEMALDLYLIHRSHHILANNLGQSVTSIRNTHSAAVRKVRHAVSRYHSWIIAQALVNTCGRAKKENDFLSRPIKECDLPIQLINLLQAAGYNNPEDIVKQTRLKDLAQLRGMGKKNLLLLRKLFAANSCEQLLCD